MGRPLNETVWMLNSNVLRKLDMQDLMVFVAVYEHGNLTDVAEALSVSQSTASYCLKKLRNSFADELFITTRTGMQATPRAADMYPHVLQIIESLNRCHAGVQAFDPTRQAVTFNLCAPEYFEHLLLPRLLQYFAALDWPVTINVHKLEADIPADALRDGSIDLVIGFGPNFHPSHGEFRSQVLLEDELVCVVDKGTLPATSLMSLKDFAERRHVYPTPWTSSTNMIDGWLAQRDYKRQVVARANSYGAALKLIAGTDYILALPRRIQQAIATAPMFGHCAAPEGLPGFSLDMLWSPTRESDSANRWLREQVIKACTALEQA